jgi:hypothetical protein
MPLIDRIPMPGLPGESFESGAKTGSSIINAIIARQQNQKKIEQQGLADQQLDKYRMGSLGIQQQGLGMRKELQPMQLELLKSKIEDLKRGGKGGAGVGQKEEMFFQDLVRRDNPNLPTDKIYEAANALRQGKTELSDGTKLNPMSPATQSSFDRLTKGSSYSGAIVPIIKANQSEAELSTIMNMANKDFEPYATTYAGYSSDQIMDSFKTDDASQKRLGNFIASQAAQYEASQIRNRIAGGEPGISATNELMGKSGQIIKTMFPRLSSTARIQATKRLDEYLKEGLKARKSVGVGASNATTLPRKTKKLPLSHFNTEKDIESAEPDVEPGSTGEGQDQSSDTVTVILGGKEHQIRRDRLDDAKMKYPELRVKGE